MGAALHRPICLHVMGRGCWFLPHLQLLWLVQTEGEGGPLLGTMLGEEATAGPAATQFFSFPLQRIRPILSATAGRQSGT